MRTGSCWRRRPISARPSRCRRSTRRRRPRSRAISAWSTSSLGRSGPTSGRRGTGIELWAGRFRLVVAARRPRRHGRDRATATVDARTTAAGRWWSASSCGRWKPRTGTASSATTGSAASARRGPVRAGAARRGRPGALAQALHAMWPVLTPEALVRRLLASPRRLAKAGRDILTAAELDALHASGDGGDGWSEADVALLDEADVLLGPVPTAPAACRAAPTATRPRRRADPGRAAARVPAVRAPARVPARARRPARDRLDCRECKATYATTTLMGDPAANELHGVYEELAHQFDVEDVPALRPADARYGHVVVDEAQDLSPDAVAGDRPAVPDPVVHPRRRRGAGSPRRRGGDVGPHPRRARRRPKVRWPATSSRSTTAPRPRSWSWRPGCSSSSHRTCTRPAPSGPPGSARRLLHTGGRPLGAADIASAVADIRRDVGAGLVAVVTPESVVADARRTAPSTSPPSTRKGWSSTVSSSSIPRPSSASHRERRAWRASTSPSRGRRPG